MVEYAIGKVKLSKCDNYILNCDKLEDKNSH